MSDRLTTHRIAETLRHRNGLWARLLKSRNHKLRDSNQAQMIARHGEKVRAVEAEYGKVSELEM
jgi:hypothetical protein